MSFTDRINRQSEDELRKYVDDLIEGHKVRDDDTVSLDGLFLYEGAPGFLRRLYQELSLPHRETIALLFLGRLQQYCEEADIRNLESDAGTITVLKLADPYLSRSSVARDVIFCLERLAKQLRKSQAPVSTIVEVHLALLNMREKLDREYWATLAREYGEDTYGVVISGLSAISVDSVFEWLKIMPSSSRLSDLLTAYLPTLYDGDRGTTVRQLVELVGPGGGWDKQAKSQIESYCASRDIKLVTSGLPVPVGAAPGSPLKKGAPAQISNAERALLGRGDPMHVRKASSETREDVESVIKELEPV